VFSLYHVLIADQVIEPLADDRVFRLAHFTHGVKVLHEAVAGAEG